HRGFHRVRRTSPTVSSVSRYPRQSWFTARMRIHPLASIRPMVIGVRPRRRARPSVAWGCRASRCPTSRVRVPAGTSRGRVVAATPMGIKEVVIASKSSWQHPYVEHLIGSIRHECLAHVMVFHEQHVQRILASYFAYYHHWRTQLSLAMDCPEPRPVLAAGRGRVVAVPEVGG